MLLQKEILLQKYFQKTLPKASAQGPPFVSEAEKLQN